VNAVLAELEDLYREKYFGFRNALATITGDQQSAHDVLQEAFVRAIKHQKSSAGKGLWPGGSGRIGFRLALRHKNPPGVRCSTPIWTCLSWIRLFRSRPCHPASRWPSGSFPPRQRLFIFLRYFADLEYSDIAEAL